MWLTAALSLALLQPAQTGKLEIVNIRATYGLLGASRPDYGILPGDMLYIAFDIAGLQADDKGRLSFGTILEVDDGKGKTIFKEDLGKMPAIVNLLGGGRVPHSVMISTGLEQSPGTYRAKVTVHDYQANKDANFTRDFTLLQPDFGLVRVQLYYDRLSQYPAPPAGAVGQTLFLNFVPCHFKRDAKNEAGFTVEFTVLDDKGSPTPVKPLSGGQSNLKEEVTYVQLRFDVPLQRAGHFKMVIKATDQVSKKTVTLSLPLNVVEVK
jgi:hypothetical protein